MSEKKSSEMIRRFDVIGLNYFEKENGEFILHSDHAAHVARLESDIGKLRDAMEVVVNKVGIGLTQKQMKQCREALARPQESEKVDMTSETYDSIHAAQACIDEINSQIYIPPPAKSEFEDELFKAAADVCGFYMRMCDDKPYSEFLQVVQRLNKAYSKRFDQLSKQPTEKSEFDSALSRYEADKRGLSGSAESLFVEGARWQHERERTGGVK